MKIQFIGAAHEVTGSCTLLEVNHRYFLVDCGMEQGKDIFQNISLPVAAAELTAVFVTHAHVDHTGMLPRLYKEGFRGSIYATEVTCNLCEIMLRDSAHIQESEAQYQTKRALRAGKPPVEPVYDMQDAEGALSRFRPCPYGERIPVAEGVTLRLGDMGHLMGSACVELWLEEGDTTKKIVFSGDVGNRGQRIISDPKPVADTDYLVVESTYGNRLHSTEQRDAVAELASCLQRTLDRGGNLVIPSFAVGRTQEMLYAIREIKEKGLIKGHGDFPVYVDSPMAGKATAVFMQCDNAYYDAETVALLQKGIDPIWFEGLTLTESTEESKAINGDKTPKVILASSGMCEAGRIRHHLKHNLWRPESTILFVGYQAEGSLGRRLQDGEKKVKLFGESITVKAEIATLQGTSGHADRDGLLWWVQGFLEKPALTFVNHGDPDSCEAFRELLTGLGYRAEAPYSGTEYDLATGQVTCRTDGKPVEKKPKTTVYQKLVEEAERLLALVKTRSEKPDKENAGLTSQIQSLIEKWKDGSR